MFDEFGINAGYVEELHTQWLRSPQSVEADWRLFFEGMRGPVEIAPPPPAAAKVNGGSTHAPATPSNGNGNGNGVAYREAVREKVNAATELQSRVAQLVNAYRVRGHLFARLDPLDNAPDAHPELEL